MATFAGKTYTNGHVPRSLLAPLDGQNFGHAELRIDAAGSWNRARAEVLEETGLVLTVRGWNRTLAEQVTFYLQRHRKARAGERVCCKWNGVPYFFTGTAHAAPPGTSNHGWALAVDIDDFGGVGQWNNPRYLAAWPILARHGWTETEGRGSIQEPWHKVYDPTKDQHRNDNPVQEDEMSAKAEKDIEKILELLTEDLDDAGMKVPPRTMWRRGVALMRRVEAAVLAGRSVELDADAVRVIAEAIPDDIAQQVADTLYARLAK